MAGIGIQTDGLSFVARRFDLFGKRAEEEVGRAIVYTARAMERSAKQFAPVRSGALRSSIRTTFGDKNLSAEIAPSVDYADYVEFGTSYMAPQPYMRPARDAHIDTLTSQVRQSIARTMS